MGPIGRDRELAELERLRASAREGRGQAVLIEGEAGVGKSHLIAALVSVATQDGFQIVAAEGDELERTVPFAPWVAALDCRPTSPDEDRAAIANLLRHGAVPMGGVEPSPVVAQVVEGLWALLDRIAARAPTLVIVEDLHWMDRSSLTALRTIIRRSADLPILVVASMRPVAADDLRSFDPHRFPGDHIRLDPLTPEAVASLTTSLTGGAPGERLTAMLDGAGGNPLFVTELIEVLRDEGALRSVDGRTEIGHDDLPPPLRQTILRRAAYLPEETLDVLRTASFLGTQFDGEELRALIDLPAEQLDRELRAAVKQGIVVQRGSGYGFRHDLVREAIYLDQSEPVRRAVHRRVATILEARGAHPLRVAEHLVRGAPVGDLEAIGWLEDALVEAFGVPDHDLATALMRAADSLRRPDDPDRDLYLPLHFPAWLETESLEAVEERLRAKLAGERPPRVEATVRALLAYAARLRGDVDRGRAEAERAVSIEGLGSRDRLVVFSILSAQAYAAGDVHWAGRLAEAGLRRAEADGDREAGGALKIVAAVTRMWTGRLLDALSLGWEALDQTEGQRSYADVAANVMVFLSDCDREEEARALAARSGAGHSGAIVFGSEMVRRGAWDDAIVEFSSLIDEEEQPGWGRGALALIATWRGNLTEAEKHLESAPALGPGSLIGQDLVAWAECEYLRACGKSVEALSVLEDRWDRLVFAPGVHKGLSPVAVALAMSEDSAVFAARVAQEASERAALAPDVRSAAAVAMWCEGLLTGDATILQRAVEQFDSLSPRQDHAASLCRLDLASSLIAAGASSDARAYLIAAMDFFEGVDADLLLRRAAALMRRGGLRRGARGKRGRPTTGWESLTPTERKVVAHVVDGKRNAEVAAALYVSPRTVSTHLQHVFMKLGVSSRVELAKYVLEHVAGADH